MELGKLAVFAGEDGKPKSVKITNEHISALMNHAGNRAIPMHWTHGWAEDGKEGLASKVGLLKNFRKDDAGNLIGDAHLSPGDHRETALWNAANDPANIMLSAVFDYAKRDPFCIPKDFRACDFVEKGAATTALLEESTASTSMDISEFITMLSDPGVKDALKAIIKTVEKGQDDADAAAMESDAGVTEADMSADDDKKPALMRACLRVTKAMRRQISAAATDKTALLAEVKTTAEAQATAFLGKSGFIGHSVSVEDADTYTATFAKYRESAPNDQVATTRMLRDKPELYPIHEQRTRERMAKFKPVSA